MHSVTSLCDSCRHRTGINTCDAFPQGIPDDILLFAETHYEPLPEQENAITYDFLNGMEEQWENWRQIVTSRSG